MRSLSLALPTALLCAASAGAQATYVDMTQDVGLDGTHVPIPGHPMLMMVGGGTIGDFNSDGWPDVFVPSGGSRADYLYINDGDGTFTESAAAWGLTDLHMGVGSAVGDYDGDGWQDLYVCSFGPVGSGGPGQNRLYHNNGNGSFTEVAVAAGVNSPSDGNRCFGAAWGDYDRDGDLDLFVTAYAVGQRGNTLYRNDGDGTFTDVTQAVGLMDMHLVNGFVPDFVDLDRDGDIDILLIADTGTSRYYENIGNDTFRWRKQYSPDLDLPNGMGLATGDIDNDGDYDYYVSNIFYPASGIGGNMLYQNDGSGSYWKNISGPAGVSEAGWAWGVAMTDMDNDGWLDIASTNGWSGVWSNVAAHLFHNVPGGRFDEMAAFCGFHHTGQGRSLLRFDADRDGDEDLLITTSSGPISYFENVTNNGNHWLRVSFDTSAAPGLAPHGIGTEVIVRRGSRQIMRMLDSNQSYLGQAELALHFGLGDITNIGSLEVRWADGRRSIFPNLAVDQHLVIRASEPALSAGTATAGAPLTLDLAGLVPHALAMVAASTNGAGPTSTPVGDFAVGAPFTLLPMPADANGAASLTRQLPGTWAGTTLYLQGFDPVSHCLSNALTLNVQ